MEDGAVAPPAAAFWHLDTRSPHVRSRRAPRAAQAGATGIGRSNGPRSASVRYIRAAGPLAGRDDVHGEPYAYGKYLTDRLFVDIHLHRPCMGGLRAADHRRQEVHMLHEEHDEEPRLR